MTSTIKTAFDDTVDYLNGAADMFKQSMRGLTGRYGFAIASYLTPAPIVSMGFGALTSCSGSNHEIEPPKPVAIEGVYVSILLTRASVPLSFGTSLAGQERVNTMDFEFTSPNGYKVVSTTAHAAGTVGNTVYEGFTVEKIDNLKDTKIADGIFVQDTTKGFLKITAKDGSFGTYYKQDATGKTVQKDIDGYILQTTQQGAPTTVTSTVASMNMTSSDILAQCITTERLYPTRTLAFIQP